MDVPTVRKAEGGSYFDDEIQTKEQVAKAFSDQVKALLVHLNTRRDHVIYVGSVTDRDNFRHVCNWWVREGALARNPTIKIDYGVQAGAIRVGE